VVEGHCVCAVLYLKIVAFIEIIEYSKGKRRRSLSGSCEYRSYASLFIIMTRFEESIEDFRDDGSPTLLRD
jgi:hypothetical protein